MKHLPLEATACRSMNSEGVANLWAGMAVKLTVPNDINFADCDHGEFRSWGTG